MNSEIEQLYQEIGQVALALADDLAGKLLIYAEVEDGVISCDLLYQNKDGAVRFKFAPDNLKALVYSLWERWQEHPGNVKWRAMTYVIAGGKFHIDLGYPDQIDEEEDTFDRRPLVIKQYFGDMPVDYSQP